MDQFDAGAGEAVERFMHRQLRELDELVRPKFDYLLPPPDAFEAVDEGDDGMEAFIEIVRDINEFKRIAEEGEQLSILYRTPLQEIIHVAGMTFRPPDRIRVDGYDVDGRKTRVVVPVDDLDLVMKLTRADKPTTKARIGF